MNPPAEKILTLSLRILKTASNRNFSEALKSKKINKLDAERKRLLDEEYTSFDAQGADMAREALAALYNRLALRRLAP